jgi:hypothetical protein
MATTYNTIKLTKRLDIIEEYNANAAITPGDLIELMSTGNVRRHATAGGNVFPPMFALEQELEGKGITNDYAAGDKVQCWVAVRGEIVYARLADGQTVVVGDPLESNGFGCLRKHTVNTLSSDELAVIYTNPVVGIALEAQDLSEVSYGESSLVGNAQYIKVRIV